MPMSRSGTPGTRIERIAQLRHRLLPTLRDEFHYVREFLRRRGLRIALLFAGVLLPLIVFGELAQEASEATAPFFDEPVLRFARALASAGLDRFFVVVSAAGYAWGVVPFDVGLVVVLALLRRVREAWFAGAALAGSALLNLGAKRLWARERPGLWESIAPEHSFSFPSGHAMGSATLATVLVLLAWPTRWRWPITMAAGIFVALVGLSRLYLGVHYPSDILAGWAAAAVWAIGVYALVFRAGHPWQRVAAPVAQPTPPA